jgi:hypothetical protein
MTARATPKQIKYIDALLEQHDNMGNLQNVIEEINPDLGEDEDFMVWMKRQDIRRASEVIDILKENL